MDLRTYKDFFTKRNIIYFCAGIYIILSAVSLTNNWIEKTTPENKESEEMISKEIVVPVPVWEKVIDKISGGFRQILCPLRYIVYLVWFAVLILLFILAFICDLITVFYFSLLEGYFNFAAGASAALISFFESIC